MVEEGKSASIQPVFKTPFHLSLKYFIETLLKQITSNSLPNNKTLNQSKFKAFADDKIKRTEQ